MVTRLTQILLALAASLLLSSCLDYEEDLVIHDDLSGEMAVVITLPDALISKYESLHDEFKTEKISKRFEGLSGVNLVAYEISGDRRPVAKLKLTFASLDSLNEAIAKNPPVALLAGKFTVKKEGEKTVVQRQLGEGEPPSDLPDFNYAQYKTHFDGKIGGTDSQFYNSHGQDVRYRYKLTELLAQKPVQTTTLIKSFPWAAIAFSVAVLAGAVFYGWKLFVKKR